MPRRPICHLKPELFKDEIKHVKKKGKALGPSNDAPKGNGANAVPVNRNAG